MLGPFSGGHYKSIASPNISVWESGKMYRNQAYVVKKEFQDLDGFVFNVGDIWTFLGAAFMIYDGILFIWIGKSDGSEWEIPMKWEPGFQLEIIENFTLKYVEPSVQKVAAVQRPWVKEHFAYGKTAVDCQQPKTNRPDKRPVLTAKRPQQKNQQGLEKPRVSRGGLAPRHHGGA